MVTLKIVVQGLAPRTQEGIVSITNETTNILHPISKNGIAQFSLIPGTYTLAYQPPVGTTVTAVVETVKVRSLVRFVTQVWTWIKGWFV